MTSQTAEVEATATTVRPATTPGSIAALVLSASAFDGILLENEFGSFSEARVTAGIDVDVCAVDVTDMEIRLALERQRLLAASGTGSGCCAEQSELNRSKDNSKAGCIGLIIHRRSYDMHSS